jgi:succinate-semialdehyde dehydrogenase/glutarate-semialdehyde dehydrogenase
MAVNVVRSGEIVITSPAGKTETGRYPIGSAETVAAAVARAREAQKAWSAISIRERARIILNARRLVCERQDKIIDMISAETGKPRFEALATEVFPIADLMSYYAFKTRRILKDRRFTLAVFRNKRSMITYQPIGVVGVISPWNFPFSIPAGDVVMALMCGNAVVLKPSEYTAGTGALIGEILEDAGVPKGLVEVVQGDGSTGGALADAPIDKLFFTGSVRTGKRIAENAARRLLPVVLELGGKDPMIVCADAPFERTVNGAVWGAFANCGQVCASVERLYVVESVADRFIPAVVEATKKLRLGPPSAGADVGPLTNAHQFMVVKDHIADAVAKGARVLAGGRSREDLGGFYFEPTVLVDVDDSMKVMSEETFGPVLPIRVVKHEDEAVLEANRSEYGLLASVWTASRRRGLDLARQIEAGTVIVNDAVYTHAAAQTPWFGIKQSGTGVTHGRSGLFEFVRMKHVNWDLAPLDRDWWWFPYSEKWHRRFRLLMRLLYEKGLRRFV